MTNSRRKFTAEQKAAIVRRHLKGKQSIATIAEELSIQPTQIHQCGESKKDRHSNSVTRKIASVNLAYFRYYQRTSDGLHMRCFAEKS